MPSFLILSGKIHYFIVCFFFCVFLLDCSYATDRGSLVRRSNESNLKCLPGWKRWPKRTGRCIVPICNNCGSRGKCIEPEKCCCSDGQLLNNCEKSASDSQETISPFADPECLCRNIEPHSFWSRRNLTHFECLDRGLNVLRVGQLPTLATPTFGRRIVRRSLTGKSIYGLDKVDRNSRLKKTFHRNSDVGSVFNKSSNMNLPKSRVTEKHGGDRKQSIKAVSTKRKNPDADLKFVWKQNGKIPQTGSKKRGGDNIEEKNKDYTKKHSSPDMMNKFLNNIYFQRHSQKPYPVQSQSLQKSEKTDPGKDYHLDNLRRFHEMLFGNYQEGKYLTEFDDSAHHDEFDYDFTFPDGTTSVQDILAAARDSPTTGTKAKAYSDSGSFSGYKNAAQEIRSSTKNYAGNNSLNERKTLLETGLNKESNIRQMYEGINPGGHKKIAPSTQPGKGNNERKQESVNYKDAGSAGYLKLISPDIVDPREWDESLLLKKMFPLKLDEKTEADSVPSYFNQNKYWHTLALTSQPQQKMKKLVPETDTEKLQQKMNKLVPETDKEQLQQKMKKLVPETYTEQLQQKIEESEIQKNHPQQKMEKIIPEMQKNQPQHNKEKIIPEMKKNQRQHNKEKIITEMEKNQPQHDNEKIIREMENNQQQHKMEKIIPEMQKNQPQQKMEKIIPEIENNQQQHKMEKVIPEMQKNQPQHNKEKIIPEMQKNQPQHDKEKIIPEIQKNQPQQKEKTASEIQPEVTADKTVANSELYQKKLKTGLEENIQKKTDRMLQKPKNEDTKSEQKGSDPSKPVYLKEREDDNRTGPKKPLFLLEQLVKNVTAQSEKNVTPYTEKNVTPYTEKNVTPYTEKNVTPHAEKNVTPYTEKNVTPYTEKNVTPYTEKNVTPYTEKNVTPYTEKNVTPHTEKNVTPYTEKNVTPYTEKNVTPYAEKNVTPHTEKQNRNYSKSTQFSKYEKDRSKIKQLSTTGMEYNDKKVLLEDKIRGKKIQSKSYLTNQDKKVTTLTKEGSVVQEHNNNNNNNKDKQTVIKTNKQKENENGMKYFDKVNQGQEGHEKIWKKYFNADDKTMITGKFSFPSSTERVSEKRPKTKQSLADKLPGYELQMNLGNLQHLKEKLGPKEFILLLEDKLKTKKKY